MARCYSREGTRNGDSEQLPVLTALTTIAPWREPRASPAFGDAATGIPRCASPPGNHSQATISSPLPTPLPQPRATKMSFRFVSHYKAGKPRLAALKGGEKKRLKRGRRGGRQLIVLRAPLPPLAPPGPPSPRSRHLPSLSAAPLPLPEPLPAQRPRGPRVPPRSPARGSLRTFSANFSPLFLLKISKTFPLMPSPSTCVVTL